MGYVVMKVVDGFNGENVQAFRDAHIAPGAEIHTDGLRAFTSFADALAKRVPQSHAHRQQTPAEGAGIGVFLGQYSNRQSQHRDQGDLQGAF